MIDTSTMSVKQVAEAVNARITENNARLADTLTAKGVEADAGEDQTALIGKVAEIKQGGGAVDGLVIPPTYFTGSAVYLDVKAEHIKGTEIRSRAFEYWYINSIEIPQTIVELVEYCFYGASIKQPLVIPDSVTRAGNACLRYINVVSEITIGTGVSALPQILIYECGSLQKLTFRGDIVSAVGNGANTLYGNYKLTDMSIGGKLYCSLSIKKSPLNIESAKNIITSLENYAGTENEFAHTITFSDATKTLIEAEGATAPNGMTWEDYVYEKGWNY